MASGSSQDIPATRGLLVAPVREPLLYGAPFSTISLTDQPFVARYSGGCYVVVDVCPGKESRAEPEGQGQSPVLTDTNVPGSVVVSVNGQTA
ncbi:MAG TPA: hypothetical protein GXX40_01605 [Firmicutes bacterium]|nr:hypothetical protein [Bacillota bacterium]